MKAILLEDEYLLNNNIKEFLELKGMCVESYTNGEVLLKKSSLKADIAILDIEAPGANGYEVLEWIKRINDDIETLFITAYTDIESIERAYTLGCSDYLKKPFDLIELWLRIEHLLHSDNSKKINLTEDIFFDMSEEQLYKNSTLLKLTKIQRDILKVLLQHKNTVVSYGTLMSEVWSDNFIKVNTIASHIKGIRKYISSDILESIRAEGYRINI